MNRLGNFLLLTLLTAALGVPAAEPAFRDVPAEAWYAPAVRACREAGLLLGDENGLFRPDDAMTAGEALTLLFNLGCRAGAYTPMETRGEAWQDGAKLLNGRLAAYFTDLDAPLSRGDFARCAAAFLRDMDRTPPEPAGAVPFADAEGADLALLYAAGIVTGEPAADGSLCFRPEEPLLRREGAAAAGRLWAALTA